MLTFVASCPICGKVLFKGSAKSYVEGKCPKCREYIKIKFSEEGFYSIVALPLKRTGDYIVQANNE